MVDKKVVDYISRYLEQDYAFEEIKLKLLESNVSEEEIDDAVSILPWNLKQKVLGVAGDVAGGVAGGVPVPKRQSGFQQPLLKQSGLQQPGLFKKIKKLLTSPSEYFVLTDSDDIKTVLKFQLKVLLIPFVLLSFILVITSLLFGGLILGLLSSVTSNLGFMGIGVIFYVFLIGFFAAFFFIFIPLLVFVSAGILNLVVKLFGGDGSYSDTYRAVVYGSVPSYLLCFIPFVNSLAFLWTFYLSLKGLSSYHRISMWRSFFCYATISMLFGFISLILMML